MYITFLGAAENVTGSRFLVEFGKTRILIDCGLFQERKFQPRNWDAFPEDPASFDAVLLTHAHIDHCGYLPKFVSDGYRGPIYCTEPTAQIAKISLVDAAKLQENDAAYKKKRHRKEGRKGRFPTIPLFTAEDAAAVAPHFKSVSFQEAFTINNEIQVTYYPAGHILGAAMLQLKVKEGGQEKTVVFSGDIGRWDRPIIHDPHIFEQADYVVMEATYGDRTHEKSGDSMEKFVDIIFETQKRGGNVVIPTFAIERAQELLYYLNQLVNDKRIPAIKTFLDSPMAIEVTKVFDQYVNFYDETAKAMMQGDDSIFHFPLLEMTKTADQSKEINDMKDPCIIMAGSGMCTGGRIKHHLIQNIGRPESTILFVGYQAVGTLGRQILERPQYVRIFGQDRKVKARIEKINGFSAHADCNELLKWVKGFKTPPKQIFIVHAEKSTGEAFTETLNSQLKIPTLQAQYLQKCEI